MRNARSPQGASRASQQRFFSRFKSRRTQKDNVRHVGQTTTVQNFFEGPDFDSANPHWVEYAPPSLPKAKREKHEGAAIQVYRRRKPGDDGDGFYIYKIRLQSPYLREALEETLEPYNIKWEDELFADSMRPHRGLFFAFDRIAELTQSGDSAEVRNHCELLCTVIEEVFEDSHEKLKALHEREMITFPLLWTLLPEGLVFAVVRDAQTPRAVRVKKVRVHQHPPQLRIVVETVSFDGWRYGTIDQDVVVVPFEGEVYTYAIPGLPYFDLSQDNELRLRLLERGKKALELQSINYMTYRANGEQRVMIDPYLYRKRKSVVQVRYLPYYEKQGKALGEPHDGMDEVNPSEKLGEEDPNEVVGNPREHIRRPTLAELEENRKAVLEFEDNLVIMSYSAAGYSITQQFWGFFQIDHLYPLEKDESVLTNVVLDEMRKDTIKTLVENHMARGANYDDLIDGKGQCLLIILNGPPGTGKTLLVESLAEHLGCPLLRADSQYFRPDWLGRILGYESSLGEFLKDASEWGGLVLFDEPDFLFQNQASGVVRKDLLAFLRHAEYFKGIIFLATNLTDSIDSAVISRAQIHLSFDSLTEPSRVRVWDNFNKRLPGDVGMLAADDIDQLAKWKINGREIKNILNMSVSWCRKKKCLLSLEIIENLLGVICSSATKESPDTETNGVDGYLAKKSALDDMLLL